MTWGSYSAYLGIAVLLVLAPGPDTLVFLRNALSGGSRGGLIAAGGILTGNLLQGSLAAFGLGVLVASSRPLFETLRWAGVAYLVFLAVQALRGAWRGDHAGIAELVEKRRGQGLRRFREGFLSNVTNPKVLIMYLSVLPQFLVPGVTTTADALVLAYTVGLLGAVYLLALVGVVHRVRGWLSRRRVRRGIDALTGSALLGFGAALAVE
ncbi:LysE family translocator [Pseudonocardia xishanensis]|uniref:LysE family translocator n=1 Tax=Pseudonocardia xishanensis TaxID=630995 RepID=A0ABP8RDE3_9PSEU